MIPVYRGVCVWIRSHQEIRPGRFPEHAEHISSGCSHNLIQWDSSMVPKATSFFAIREGLT